MSNQDNEKVIMDIHFEDNGQDVQSFRVSFYPDFQFGEVLSADMQNNIWQGYFVLSGKPAKGRYLRISKGPSDKVVKFIHKVIGWEIVEPETVGNE